MILSKPRAGDLSGLCCAILDYAMPRSAGCHSRLATARRPPRRRSARLDTGVGFV